MTQPNDATFGVEQPWDGLQESGLGYGFPADPPAPAADVETAVRAEVVAMAATDQFPALTSTQLDALIARAKRSDYYGRSVSDAHWIPTYDTTWAIWQAWKMKAANAVGMVDVMVNQNSVSRSQVMQQCLAMAAEWAKKVHSSKKAALPRQIDAIPGLVEVPWAPPA